MIDFAISEAQYTQTMQDTVLPYLEKRETVLWLEREPGHRQYCACYQADLPRGIILISHGFTESAEKYQELIYYFLLENYSVCLPEHCGHGRSYRLTDDPSLIYVDHYERYIEDLLYAAHRMQAEAPGLPLFLFAHSMGGGIGIAAAAQEPSLFSRIILSSPMIRPQTAGVPWRAARLIAGFYCCIGQSRRYVAGQHPYRGEECFETSSSTSRVRFDRYQARKKAEPLFQTSAASYGWLREAARLNSALQHHDWKNLQAPILLFQAETETLVSKKEQHRFLGKLSRRRKVPVKMIVVPGSRHEIFNSNDRTLRQFLRKVFAFYEGLSS